MSLNPDDVLNWFNDPWSAIIVAILVVGFTVGLLYTKQAIIDLLQGKWK